MHLNHVDRPAKLHSYGFLNPDSSPTGHAENAVAEEAPGYQSQNHHRGDGVHSQARYRSDSRTDHSASVAENPDSHSDTLNRRLTEAEAIRLAMALIEGAHNASEDRSEKVEKLRERIRHIGGQAPATEPESNENLGNRLRSLARTRDRNLAEQLRLQVLFDEAEHYKLDGCRSMIVWMDVHLGIAKTNASEQLRVGRALQQLPILESLFTLGQISFSQLREVTRVATPQTDAEFALATLALSVSETREYCLRFRHESDRDEDARLAAQHGQEISDAHAALRAYERRSLTVSEPDAHTTRIVIELPRELGEEFRRSLEQCEDWIREGGEDPDIHDILHNEQTDGSFASTHSDIPGTLLPRQTTTLSASRPSATQRRADAALLMSRRSLAHAGQAVAMADRYRVHVNLDFSQLIASFADGGGDADETSEGVRGSSTGCCQQTQAPDTNGTTVVERPWLHGSGPVPQATARRLAELAGFSLVLRDDDGEVFATADKAPPFTRRQLQTLRARDQRCQMPGCGSTRHAEGHHIVHRENGGQSTMDNAVYLCGSCHRLLHEGGFRLERIGPNGADLGQQARQVHTADSASRKRAQAKIARVRRYRLYGADGQEYHSVNAARASLNIEEPPSRAQHTQHTQHTQHSPHSPQPRQAHGQNQAPPCRVYRQPKTGNSPHTETTQHATSMN